MNANQPDQKIIEKLQKLLALSASSNEHEAGLALCKAEALMREHHMSVADVALNGSGAHVHSEEVSGLTKSTQKWETNLGAVIAWTFGGKAIYCVRPGTGWSLTFIAGRTDLAIIVDLYERLRDTVKRMSKDYASRTASPAGGPMKQRFLGSYRLGMVRTIQERLTRVKENTTPSDQATNAYGLTGKELLVVKDRAIAQHLAQLFPNLRTRHGRSSRVVGSAYQQGRDDGHAVSLHRAVDTDDGPMAIDHR